MEAGAGAPDAAKKEDVEPKPEAVAVPPPAVVEANKPVEEVKRPVEEVEKPVEEEVEDVPDPDEDDLDDLDDMLDDFSTIRLEPPKKPTLPVSTAKPEPLKAAPTTATPAPAPAAAASFEKEPSLEDAFSEEEFTKQLQAGMADLLGELEKSPDMQKQFEDMFSQISKAAAGEEEHEPTTGAGKDTKASAASASAPASASASASASADDASFQETIRRTMERMQASGDQATAAAASGASDDFMSEMLKQMSAGDLGGEGSEEEFSKMLMSMMEQLTNKEILYEPMKELDDKFPDWLRKNRDKTPKDDLKRYEDQQVFVREIVGKFEEKTYSDSNAADREFIVDKMQKMQAMGSPPPDLVGDLPSAQEVFSAPDDSCNPQ